MESGFVHQLYDPNDPNHMFNYDIALIKVFDNYLKLLVTVTIVQLNRKVTFDSRIQPICLPEDDGELTKKSGYMTGWGRYTCMFSSNNSSFFEKSKIFL